MDTHKPRRRGSRGASWWPARGVGSARGSLPRGGAEKRATSTYRGGEAAPQGLELLRAKVLRQATARGRGRLHAPAVGRCLGREGGPRVAAALAPVPVSAPLPAPATPPAPQALPRLTAPYLGPTGRQALGEGAEAVSHSAPHHSVPRHERLFLAPVGAAILGPSSSGAQQLDRSALPSITSPALSNWPGFCQEPRVWSRRALQLACRLVCL